MEFPIVIEYVKCTENTIADILSRFEGHTVEEIVERDIATGVALNVCLNGDADRLELGTHCLNEWRANRSISRVAHLVASGAKHDADEIQLNPALKWYLDVWNLLVVENGLLRHVNGNRHSSCIAVPPNLRKNVASALHLLAHHGFDSTLSSVAQRFWWPHVRGDISAFVRGCEVCDRNSNSNPNPHTAFGHLPADQLFASFYIDIVGGQGSLSLGAGLKSILIMIDGLTGWAEAVPIDNQRADTVAHVVYSK